MLDQGTRSILKEIFDSYKEIIAVYLFGSYLENKELARDIDLAVLLDQPVKSQVEIYMSLYPRLAEALAPLAFIGHGVGIELDELPVLARGSKMLLEAGMVIALEPKFVFPAEGAVGIENTFLVTEAGLETLTVYEDKIQYV